MAILSTFMQHAHKYDFETAAILRSCASIKNKYPEFIATLLTSPYTDDIIHYARDPGFFATYKRMLSTPSNQEELLMLPELKAHVDKFPLELRTQLSNQTFKWPTLTDIRLIALKQEILKMLVQEIHAKKVNTITSKKVFYSAAIQCDPQILAMSETMILDYIKSLDEEQQSILLAHWYQEGPEEFKLLSDKVTNLLYT